MGKKYFYARVSTKDQKLDRQIDKFRELGATDRTLFTEKISGKNFQDREAWKDLMNWAAPGDTIIVKNLDRLGRNKDEVKSVLINLSKKGIYVESVDQAYLNDFLNNKLKNKESETFNDAVLEIVLNTILELDLIRAEWERKEMLKRQKEGIEAAKKRGVRLGRKTDTQMREKFKELYPLTRNKNLENYMTVAKALKEIGCSKAQFYKMENELKQGGNENE